MFMKITSDETEYICPICHQVKENNNYTPERACSHATPQKAPTTKDYYLQKRYNELICGFTLDHIQSKQVEATFNALVEFIESTKKKKKKKNHTSKTVKLQTFHFKNFCAFVSF